MLSQGGPSRVHHPPATLLPASAAPWALTAAAPRACRNARRLGWPACRRGAASVSASTKRHRNASLLRCSPGTRVITAAGRDSSRGGECGRGPRTRAELSDHSSDTTSPRVGHAGRQNSRSEAGRQSAHGCRRGTGAAEFPSADCAHLAHSLSGHASHLGRSGLAEAPFAHVSIKRPAPLQDVGARVGGLSLVPDPVGEGAIEPLRLPHYGPSGFTETTSLCAAEGDGGGILEVICLRGPDYKALFWCGVAKGTGSEHSLCPRRTTALSSRAFGHLVLHNEHAGMIR